MFVRCPYCHIDIEILEVNCGIFRCGIFKDTGEQLPSHLSEEGCELAKPFVWGCTRPFMLMQGTPIPCGYL
jgi:hypothetical protein